MSKKFIKNKEDFICSNCGHEVSGTGYTNHCPRCLYSQHVDIYPGDRDESCRGIMAPISLIKKGESFVVIHRCLSCGEERQNKTNSEDDIGSLLSSMI